VTSETAWDHLIGTTVATYGKLDILVNNAGISGTSVGDKLALARFGGVDANFRDPSGNAWKMIQALS
jgi:NAD(P)-dependent dehydrogenase (short-subunit alcohol dehydrogenase family)